MTDHDQDIRHEHAGKEFVEDGCGDFILTIRVIAATFEAARQHSQYLKEHSECRGSNWTWKGVWECKGGKLVTTYDIYVDGIEYAIEQRNHAWASVQTEIDHRYGQY
jgi:hypothetical protein